MFYEPAKNDHGLPFNPFKSCVVPRPIAWISTISRDGIVNLAPFSQSNILGWDPPYVMFSAYNRWNGSRTDSVTNAESTGEFVYNMATYALRDAVVESSMIEEPGVDEMAATRLTPTESRLVKPPRVKESPINMECKHYQTIVLANDTPGMFNSVVIGRVVGIHIHDDYIGKDGKLDIVKMRPLARMGYLDYTSVTDVFEIRPAGVSDDFIRGMSGGSGSPAKEIAASSPTGR
jgi:flavin reductase (DIM6/NTAB) family NADH-FMN oxidoreductase RutF